MLAHRLPVCFALFLAGGFATVSLSGCGGDRGPERVIVSGTVTYDGKAIPEGNIRFTPISGSTLPAAGATIVDGRYKADARGGVPVGTHRIEVEAYRMIPVPARPGGLVPPGGRVRQQYLAKRHNVDSQLQITVESGSPNITKNFDLTD